jgi:glutamate synthase domain-containing protein 1
MYVCVTDLFYRSVLESYVRAGFGAEEALMILVPEAFESQPKLRDKLDVKAFYSYYEALQEAWDGKALLVVILICLCTVMCGVVCC